MVFFGIAKEQRVYLAVMQQGVIMSLSKRLTLGDQVDENVWLKSIKYKKKCRKV